MSKKNNLKMKQKLALALFMEAVPKIISLWKERAPDKTFDEFCLEQYELGKNKNIKEGG